MRNPREAPLIYAKRVPRWTIVRDIFVTVAAWICILHFMPYTTYLVYDYVSAPIFKLTRTSPPAWFDIWYSIRGFVLLSAFMVVWIAFWGFFGARRARTERPAPQPAPLSIAEHAEAMGVTEDELLRWKTYRISVVVFDNENKIADVLSQDLAATVAKAAG